MTGNDTINPRLVYMIRRKLDGVFLGKAWDKLISVQRHVSGKRGQHSKRIKDIAEWNSRNPNHTILTPGQFQYEDCEIVVFDMAPTGQVIALC